MIAENRENGNPSPAGLNGQDSRGRFLPGNKIGKGNPLNQKMNQLRAALMEAVTTEDVTKIARRLVRDAKKGDVHAVKELFDRVLGKPVNAPESSGDDSEQTMAVPREVLIEMIRAAGNRVKGASA